MLVRNFMWTCDISRYADGIFRCGRMRFLYYIDDKVLGKICEVFT